MSLTYWRFPFRATGNPQATGVGSEYEPDSLVCSILDLPRELRDRIFEFALVSGYHEGEVWLSPPDEDLPYQPPALLATCHQIRNEASETYFKKTKFLFEDVTDCKRWLLSLDQATRSHIRHLGYCSQYQEDDADPLGDRSAEECLVEIQAYLNAAGLDVKKALRVCNGCSYRYRHNWVGWAPSSDTSQGSTVKFLCAHGRDRFISEAIYQTTCSFT